jgi:hypothetical protein
MLATALEHECWVLELKIYQFSDVLQKKAFKPKQDNDKGS